MESFRKDYALRYEQEIDSRQCVWHTCILRPRIYAGVYAWVRHPMYFGALFLIVGTPLALGSWYTLALTLVLLIVLYFRIRSEEKVLVRDLVGYVEYQNEVKYRLIPFVW
jgi:protein-S-isoprenylcysteine O-methyltransferase Ste14